MGLDTHRVSNKVSKITSRHLVPLDRAFPAHALVRVSLPGGLALAVSGLLGLQSISLHNDPHVYGELLLAPHLARAGFSALLVALAYFGWGQDQTRGISPPAKD